MEYIIKVLSENLTKDYLDFFDHRAFSDDNPNGPCYCTSPTMSKDRIETMVSEFGNDVKGTLRRYAEDMLKNNEIHGYLVYHNDISIGWCNAYDMDGYQSFVPDRARILKCGKTISIVCFEIAPEHRGKGIATELIQRICKDAKRDGYDAVEGYAEIREDMVYNDFYGPYNLYKKLGFEEIETCGNQVIMRYVL